MSLEVDLRAVDVFRDLESDEIAWLAERVEIVEFAVGGAVHNEGDPADFLLAVVEGEVRGQKEKGLTDGLHYIVRKGQVSGMLPNSRMTHFPITMRAVVPSRVALVPARLFTEMLKAIPVLEPRLASVMADRVKDTTEQIQLRERLVGLGKLSAGLAHELNNPAAAIRRSAEELQTRVAGLSRMCEVLLSDALGAAPSAALGALKDARQAVGGPANLLERSRAEDELAAWLDGLGVDASWVVAETFAEAGIERAHLEELDDAPASVRRTALRWLEAHLASRQLVAEIAEAADRISGILSAVKSYSHMDRAPAAGAVDVVEGLESTIAVLAHKWRDKGLRVTREYGSELPAVVGNAGELNQVWTNLLDNAIDASPVGGEIVVQVERGAADVGIWISDRGGGIPTEIQTRIFEPFFSTKEVGRGTGLGLDIAKRIVNGHRGEIRVESVPGRTTFEVRLPNLSVRATNGSET